MRPLNILGLQEKHDFNYELDFKAGMVTGGVATLIFTFFFAFYATEINTDFLKELSTSLV